MKQFFLFAFLIFSLTNSLTAKVPKSSPKSNQAKSTFVLVHGAWLAPWCWKAVKEQLEKKGEKVVLVELPGHGDDKTAANTLTIDMYKEKVITAMNQVPGKVILVGHSMAGVVITAVTEQVPDKIDKLIYIAAYLPASGQSLLDLANTDAGSLLGPSLVPSEDKLMLDVKHENIINIFCQDSKPEVQKMLMDHFKAEPAIPFTNPVTITTGKFGKVDKYYIHTTEDHVVGIDLQNRMIAAASITKVYSLKSSHTPFLSMPDKVTDLFLKIAN